MTEIQIILLGLLSAWEEINELYRDGSWDREMFYPFLFWDTNPNSKLKNFDSKHVSFGAFALVMCITILNCAEYCAFSAGLFSFISFSWILNTIAQIIALWWFFFYVRNIGMHILLRRKNFRQWKYALPIHFWIEYKASWF